MIIKTVCVCCLRGEFISCPIYYVVLAECWNQTADTDRHSGNCLGQTITKASPWQSAQSWGPASCWWHGLIYTQENTVISKHTRGKQQHSSNYTQQPELLPKMTSGKIWQQLTADPELWHESNKNSFLKEVSSFLLNQMWIIQKTNQQKTTLHYLEFQVKYNKNMWRYEEVNHTTVQKWWEGRAFMGAMATKCWVALCHLWVEL